MCFFKNFLKVSKKRFFDALQEFSKSSQNTGEKMFAKYLSADGKNNTINCNDNDAVFAS